AAVHDVLDEDHLTSGEVEVEVLHDADDAAGAGGAAVRRHRHEVDLDVEVDGLGQVGHEEEGALQHADQQGRPTGVVLGDLVAELGDPVLQLLRADHALPQLGVDVVRGGERHRRHASGGVRRARRGAGPAPTPPPSVVPSTDGHG